MHARALARCASRSRRDQQIEAETPRAALPRYTGAGKPRSSGCSGRPDRKSACMHAVPRSHDDLIPESWNHLYWNSVYLYFIYMYPATVPMGNCARPVILRIRRARPVYECLWPRAARAHARRAAGLAADGCYIWYRYSTSLRIPEFQE